MNCWRNKASFAAGISQHLKRSWKQRRDARRRFCAGIARLLNVHEKQRRDARRRLLRWHSQAFTKFMKTTDATPSAFVTRITVTSDFFRLMKQILSLFILLNQIQIFLLLMVVRGGIQWLALYTVINPYTVSELYRTLLKQVYGLEAKLFTACPPPCHNFNWHPITAKQIELI